MKHIQQMIFKGLTENATVCPTENVFDVLHESSSYLFLFEAASASFCLTPSSHWWIDDLSHATFLLACFSTDHGGHEFSHGDAIDDDMIIPIILRGPGIKRNYTFNFEVGNQDIPPTVTWALGLTPSNWWTGKNRWEAFENLNP